MKLIQKEINTITGGSGFCTCELFEPVKRTCTCGKVELEISGIWDLASSLENCMDKCCNTPNIYGARTRGFTYTETEPREEQPIHELCN